MDSVGYARIRNHITSTLGPIELEWDRTGQEALPFSVVRLKGRPTATAWTYATIGLSERVLRFPSGKSTRQELVFAFEAMIGCDLNVQGLLASVGRDLHDSGLALARGAILGPHGPLFPLLNVEALYASLPVYFPDEFASCSRTSPATHFMWLVPITTREALFAARAGWNAFEDELVRQDPDLLNLTRTQIVLPVLD